MKRLREWDRKILFKIHGLQNPKLNRVFVLITRLGDGCCIWIVIGILLLAIPSRRLQGFWMFVVIAICALINNILIKSCFLRNRPCDTFSKEILIRRPIGSSFPSGHTATSFAGALYLCSIDYRFGIVAMLLAGAISFSRMYLFVHYPSDVLFGIISGLGITFVLLHFIL